MSLDLGLTLRNRRRRRRNRKRESLSSMKREEFMVSRVDDRQQVDDEKGLQHRESETVAEKT